MKSVLSVASDHMRTLFRFGVKSTRIAKIQ